MKKRLKCIVVLLACCLMIFSSTSSVLAANVSTPKQYTDFCCIGDSISTGWLSEFGSLIYDKNYDEDGSDPTSAPRAHYGNAPEGSYPALLRKAINGRYHSMACVGQQLVEATWVLGGFEDEFDYEGSYSYHYAQQGQRDRWEMIKYMHDSGEGKNRIRKSSLVTILSGSTDLFITPKNASIVNGKLDPTLFIKNMKSGILNFNSAYPKLIKSIKKLNPLADVVTISLFNPFTNLKLSGDDHQKTAGKLLGLFIDAANMRIKQWAEEYGCIYVDITEIGKSFRTITFDFDKLKDIEDLIEIFDLKEIRESASIEAHPGKVAHAYIAEQVINALPREESRSDMIGNGLFHIEFGDADIGNYTFRRKGSGWTMRNMRGEFICVDNGSIELRESDPTVWQYDGGLYTNTSGKVYLSGTKDDLTLSNDKVSIDLYKAN